MIVQESWRDLICFFSFNCLFNDWGLGFRPGHDDYFFCFADCLNSHSDSAFGHFLNTSEWIGSIFSSQSMQVYQPSNTFNRRRWLIESDMASSTYSQNLKVYSSIFLNLLFIFITELCNIFSWDLTVRNINVLFWDVNMVEQIVMHIEVIALDVVFSNGKILIEVESHYIFEWNLFIFIHPYQFLVNSKRSWSSG